MLSAIVPGSFSIILKFRTNNNNSYRSPLLNKDIFNSYRSIFSDVESLRDLIFMQYIYAYVSLLVLLI